MNEQEQMFPRSAVERLVARARFKGELIGMGLALLSLLLVLGVRAAMAAEVSSVRSSDHEWFCEDANGVEISGHTRQDKAFQSCMNMALATGQTYFVRGGTYRVTASGTAEPEPDPDPTPEPDPDPPPGESPQVTFGPTTTLIQFPASISALKQDAFRWQLTFTLNTAAGIQGLASRDENGTTDPGHLSVWVNNGRLIARHQSTTDSIEIEASSTILPGVEYVASVSVEANVGIAIHLDGVPEASATEAFGTAGNDLPLVVGGLCTRCLPDGTVGPDRPIDGVVHLAIYDDPLPMPEPVAIMLNWTNPTEDEDGDPLPAGIPDRISVYKTDGISNALLTHLDGESISYEATGLAPGEHCFVATAWNTSVESRDSNTVCKSAP